MPAYDGKAQWVENINPDGSTELNGQMGITIYNVEGTKKIARLRTNISGRSPDTLKTVLTTLLKIHGWQLCSDINVDTYPVPNGQLVWSRFHVCPITP